MPPARLLAAPLRRLWQHSRRSAAIWRARLAHPLSPALRRQLRDATSACREHLLSFGRSSDEEFTALARGLAQLNTILTRLRTHNEQFQLLLEDRDAEQPLASAHEIYKRSIDLVHSSIGIAVSEQEQMQNIEQALLAACAASDRFRRNQMLLRIITLSIRMEAARMEPENQSIFLNVGDAIADITARITASTEGAFERIEAVIAEAATERAVLQSIERDLYTQARSSIHNLQHELASLQAALAPCAGQSRTVATLFEKTGPLTMRTLSSLQHQDIVRQQLEHIGAGFLDLQQHLDETSRGRRGARSQLAYLRHAADVQQAHLRSARHEIELATREVTTGLEEILTASTELVAGLATMEEATSAAFADFRIVEMFQGEIRQLSEVADKSRETNRNISQLVHRIEEVVRVFAEEIGHHELGVKIVALNAQIAAARVPSADALDRLAEETSRVSNDNTAVTRQLLTNLQAGLDQLRGIKASADEFLAIVTDEKSALESGVAIVTGKLTRLSQRVRGDVRQARQDFDSAHADTVALLRQIQLPELIAASFPPVEELCARLLALGADAAEATPLSSEAAARLEAHRDRYTMQKENVTHATVLAAPGTEVAAAAPTSSNDDGIELF